MLNKFFIKVEYPIQIEIEDKNTSIYVDNTTQDLLSILDRSNLCNNVIEKLQKILANLHIFRKELPYIITCNELNQHEHYAYQRIMNLLNKHKDKCQDKLKTILEYQDKYLRLLFTLEDILNKVTSMKPHNNSSHDTCMTTETSCDNTILRFSSCIGDINQTLIKDKGGDISYGILITLYNMIVICYYVSRLYIKKIKKKKKQVYYDNIKIFIYNALTLIQIAIPYVKKYENLQFACNDNVKSNDIKDNKSKSPSIKDNDTNLGHDTPKKNRANTDIKILTDTDCGINNGDNFAIENTLLFYVFLTHYFNGLLYEIQIYNPSLYKENLPEYLMSASRNYLTAYNILNNKRNDIHVCNTFLVKNLEYYRFLSQLCKFEAYYEMYILLKSSKKQSIKANPYLHLAQTFADDMNNDIDFSWLIKEKGQKPKNNIYTRFMEKKKIIDNLKIENEKLDLCNFKEIQSRKDDKIVYSKNMTLAYDDEILYEFKANIDIINALYQSIKTYKCVLSEGVDNMQKHKANLQSKYHIDGLIIAYAHVLDDNTIAILLKKLELWYKQKDKICKGMNKVNKLWENLMNRLANLINKKRKEIQNNVDVYKSVSEHLNEVNQFELQFLLGLQKEVENEWINDIKTQFKLFVNKFMDEFDYKAQAIQNIIQDKSDSLMQGIPSTPSPYAINVLKEVKNLMEQLDLKLSILKNNLDHFDINPYIRKTLKSPTIPNIIRLLLLENKKKGHNANSSYINQMVFGLLQSHINFIDFEKQYLHNMEINHLFNLLKDKLNGLKDGSINKKEVEIIQMFVSKAQETSNFHNKIKNKYKILKSIQKKIDNNYPNDIQKYDLITIERLELEKSLADPLLVTINAAKNPTNDNDNTNLLLLDSIKDQISELEIDLTESVYVMGYKNAQIDTSVDF